MGISDIEHNLGRANDKLDAIAQSLNTITQRSGNSPAMADDEDRQLAMDDVAHALRDGRTVEAIKHLRTATSLPLKRAKDWVEWFLGRYEIKRKD